MARDIREVWDFRLSTAVPTIYNQEGGNWRVEIHSKGENNEVLLAYDTGIPATPNNNWNDEALDACYAWLRSVRDQFSRDDVEELKPIVAQINAANAELSKRGAA